MFGYDDRQLERIRRWGLVSWPWILFELLLGGLGVAFILLLHALNDPALLQERLDAAFEPTPFRVTVGDVAILPEGSLFDPTTWRVVLSDFHFQPRDPKKTEFRVERFVASFPSIPRFAERALWFEEADVYGLTIQAHQQRPAEPRTPKRGAIDSLGAGLVRLHGGSFEAPKDPPLGRAAMSGIRATLQDVTYVLVTKELTASGRLEAREFVSGAITLDGVTLSDVKSVASDLTFDGTARLAGRDAHIHGDILHFHERGAITIRVTLSGMRLERLVALATDQRSPVIGNLDLDFVVHSGGDVPRGGAWMEGGVRITDGRVILPPDTKAVVLDLIRIAPYLKLGQNNQVILGDMDGSLRLDRRSVTIRELHYQAQKRSLEIRGHIDMAEDMEVIVRLVPLNDPDERAGIGLVLWGPPTQPKFRLATRKELLPEAYTPADRGAFVGDEDEEEDVDRERRKGPFQRKKKDEP